MCVCVCVHSLLHWGASAPDENPCKVLERPGNSDLGCAIYEKLNVASKKWRPLFRPFILIACAKCNLVSEERVVTPASIGRMVVHKDIQSCEEFLRETRDWMKTLTMEDLLEGGSWLRQPQLIVASARNHLARR